MTCCIASRRSGNGLVFGSAGPGGFRRSRPAEGADRQIDPLAVSKDFFWGSVGDFQRRCRFPDYEFDRNLKMFKGAFRLPDSF